MVIVMADQVASQFDHSLSTITEAAAQVKGDMGFRTSEIHANLL
jgi:hypothetical protein